MKRVLLVLALASTLGGCATSGGVDFTKLVSTAVVGVQNPITEERLQKIEQTAIVVVAGLKAWKASCQKGLLPRSCRQQVAAVQVYTRQIPPYLTKLRTFVRENDQVNAITLFNTVSDLIATAQSTAAQSGQNIGGVL